MSRLSSACHALLLVDLRLKGFSEISCSGSLLKRIVLSGPPVIVKSKLLSNHVLQLKVDFVANSFSSNPSRNLQCCSGPEKWIVRGLCRECEELDESAGCLVGQASDS